MKIKEGGQPMPPGLRLAMHCATWPLALAGLIMMGALYTRSVTFAGLGTLLLWVSVPVNICGWAFLFKSRLDLRGRPDELNRWKGEMRWCLLLLLLSYPVAVLCMFAGCDLVMPKSDPAVRVRGVLSSAEAQIV